MSCLLGTAAAAAAAVSRIIPFESGAQTTIDHRTRRTVPRDRGSSAAAAAAVAD